MRKKKQFKELEIDFARILDEFAMIHLKIRVLEREIAEVGNFPLHHVKKIDYESDKIWYTKRLGEMESKLSMKFYHYTEIMPKLRMEFGGLLSELKIRIEELERRLRENE